ncbi:MAG TPA: hypothetical protein VHH09_07775, partial [Acidimicrobiales bacterium]|nr:hypothetical protein [Acidimicrobiales bacterium]
MAGAMVLTVVGLTSRPSFAVQFCNTTPVVGQNGPVEEIPFRSNPYPSPITVSGLTGTVTYVNVTLLGVTTRPQPDATHWPSDLDVMVSAPNGSN